MTREQVYAAKRLINDETFTDAIGVRLKMLEKKLFATRTQEDREQIFQEHSALKRVVNDLKVTAHKTHEFDAHK